MKNRKLGAIALASALLFSAFSTTNIAEAASFKDVSKTHWAYNSVDVMSDKGVVKGYGDGLFKPSQSVTRAHSAMFLARSLKLDTSKVKTSPYKDVKATTSGFKEIVALQQLGVFASAENFNPNSDLTRAQMAKIIVESYNLKPSTKGKNFNDVSKSHWSHDYIKTISAYGITSGVSEFEFKPNEPVSRAQMVSFLHRTEEVIAKDPSIVQGYVPKLETSVNSNKPDQSIVPEKPVTPIEPVPPVVEPEKPVTPIEPVPPVVEPEKPVVPEPPVIEPNPGSDNSIIDTNRNYSKHEDIQDEFVRLLSEYRVQNGLPAISKDNTLTQVAGFRSWDMATNDYFGHVSPTYGGFANILEVFRPENSFGSEVIASMIIGRGATGDARAALDNFKSSYMHNEAILTESYTKVGVGIETSSDGYTTIITAVISY